MCQSVVHRAKESRGVTRIGKKRETRVFKILSKADHSSILINMNDVIYQLKEKIIPILKEAGVVRSSLFGSAARGENAPESDIDILVELGRPMGFFKFVGLQQKLEEVLKKKVDLLTYRSINPRLKEYIERDEILIYGKES